MSVTSAFRLSIENPDAGSEAITASAPAAAHPHARVVVAQRGGRGWPSAAAATCCGSTASGPPSNTRQAMLPFTGLNGVARLVAGTGASASSSRASMAASCTEFGRSAIKRRDHRRRIGVAGVERGRERAFCRVPSFGLWRSSSRSLEGRLRRYDGASRRRPAAARFEHPPRINHRVVPHRRALARPRAPAAGTGPYAKPAAARSARGCRRRPRSRRPLAAFGAEVDDPVGGLDHVEIVLDDEQRVPGFEQLPERGQQLGDVVEVQPGRRLVEDVEQPVAACATTDARRS